MKRQELIIFILFFCHFFAFNVFGIKNPNIVNPSLYNPASVATVPPTHLSSGLHRSPNPIDTSGNLVITGNVRRGKHFRGIVPYNAVTDFQGTLGSSSLDSFLRDSVGYNDFNYRSGGLTPYYSPTRTVTTTIPGTGRVFTPPVSTATQRGQSYSPPLLPKRQLTDAELFNITLRPMSTDIEKLEKVLLGELEDYYLTQKQRLEELTEEQKQQPEEVTEEQEQQQWEQLERDLQEVKKKAEQLRKDLTEEEDESEDLETESKLDKDLREIFESSEQTEEFDEERQEDKQIDVYERMKQQIEKMRKDYEHLLEEKGSKEGMEFEQKPDESDEQPVQEEKTLEEKIAEISINSSKAKKILGEHKSFASYSKSKFNQYMQAGEKYLKEGRYYRAADAYTMATIYKPSDPLAYAGKSHALFGAGEYMSSALYLSRALEIFPEYIYFKVDLEGMIGDRDKLESRIKDFREAIELSGAWELEFLFGYVCYQLNRLEWAMVAIDEAYEKVPNSFEVLLVKKVIDAARDY